MIKVFFETDERGTVYWFIEGTRYLHRENGPAIEYADGHKEWYQNGKLHREDGPAVEWIDGYKEYWLNNEYYPYIKTDEEWIIFQIIN